MSTSPQITVSVLEDNKLLYQQVNAEAVLGPPKVCTICMKKASLSVCVRCQRSICKECIGEKVKIAIAKKKKLDSDKKKICKACEIDIQEINQIASQSEGLGKDSVTAMKWLSNLGLISKEDAQRVNTSKDISPQLLSSITEKYSSTPESKLVSQIEVKFGNFIIKKANPSLKHILFLTMGGLNYDDLKIKICRLVNKLSTYYNWDKPPIKVDVILLFFLIFSTEATAFALFTRLFDTLFPSYMIDSILFNSNKNTSKKGELWQAQLGVLQKVLALNHEVDENSKKGVQIFFERYCLDLLTSIFINILPFPSAFHAISSLISIQSFVVIENYLISLIMENSFILKDLSTADHLRMYQFLERTTINSEIVKNVVVKRPPTNTLPQTVSFSDKGLLNPNQFQQNYKEMMLSPNFNQLINNDEVEPAEDSDDDQNKPPQMNISQNLSPPIMINVPPVMNSTQNAAPPGMNSSENPPPQMNFHLPAPPMMNSSQDGPPPMMNPPPQQECQKCIQREKILEQLRIENESMLLQIQQGEKDSQRCQILESRILAVEKERDEISESVREERETPRGKLFDKYKQLVKDSKQLYSELVEKSQSSEKALIVEKEQILSESIQFKSLLLSQLNSEKSKSDKILEQLEAERKEVEVSRKKQEENEAQLNAVIKQLNVTKQSEVDASLKQFTIVEEKYKLEISQFTKTSHNDKIEIEKYQSEIIALQQEIDRTVKSNKEDIIHFTQQCNIAYLELRKQIEELEGELAKQIEQLKQTQINQETDKKKYEEEIDKLKKISLTLETKLKEKNNLIASHQVQLLEKDGKIESLEKETQRMKTELEGSAEAKIQFEKLQVENKQTNESLSSAKTEINSLTQANEKLTADLSSTKSLLEAAEKQRSQNEIDISGLLKKIAELEKQLEESQSKLKKAMEDLEKVQKELVEMTEKYTEAQEKLDKYFSIFTSVKQTVTEAENDNKK